MDLRSIINSDSAPDPPPRASRRATSPPKPNYEAYPQLVQPHGSPRTNYYGPPLETRPPLQQAFQQSTQNSSQSPLTPLGYQPNQPPYNSLPSSSISSGQYSLPPQSAGVQVSPASSYHHLEKASTINMPSVQAYGPPGPQHAGHSMASGPTSYVHQSRPQSSHSSVPPGSAQSHVQSFPRDSPTGGNAQIPAFSQAQGTYKHQSQPGTPLGPPPFPSKSSPNTFREPSGIQIAEYQRSILGGRNHPAPPYSPMTDTSSVSLHSPAQEHPRNALLRNLTDGSRDRSPSVSPKTRIEKHIQRESAVAYSRQVQESNHSVTQVKRGPQDDAIGGESRHNMPGSTFESKAEANGNSTHDTAHFSSTRPYAREEDSQRSDSVMNHRRLSSNPLLVGSQRTEPPSNEFGHPGARHLHFSPPSQAHQDEQPRVMDLSTKAKVLHKSRPSMSASVASSTASSTAHPPVKIPASVTPRERNMKRRRYEEAPVFARKAARVTGGKPVVPRPRSELNHAPIPRGGSNQSLPTKPQAVFNEQVNGNSIHQESDTTQSNSLRPWEPTISNMIPAEELTKLVSDFLFTEVVSRNDVGGADSGASTGAVLEIEAKIGQLIDRTTNDRLRLPVLSEAVLNRNDPSLHTMFKSSMTEDQHRAYNKFLNQSLMASLPPKSGNKSTTPKKPRIPMAYVHTRERDAFYELSQSAELTLPGSIRAQLHSRQHRAKVRLTRDQKTGKELAKIIKVRVADLDVYSPRTPFDWRISVNLEMQYDGDLRDLKEVMDGGKKAPERNKDRVTYRHLAYQFDLTQVIVTEGNTQIEKEHELEIELATTEVRKHGRLLLEGKPNGYEDLVRGFVDNVRLLARHCGQGR